MNKIGNAFDTEMLYWSNSNIAEILEQRQTPPVLISDTLLDSQGLQHLEDSERTPDSAVLITMQAELGRIIEDIQAQPLNSSHASRSAAGCWVDAVYRELNARLWNWHDSLPGEMRWNRWSCQKQDVDPSLALLQYSPPLPVSHRFSPTNNSQHTVSHWPHQPEQTTPRPSGHEASTCANLPDCIGSVRRLRCFC